MKALVTYKIGMTSTITENGAMQAMTLLKAEPNIITQLKTEENEGYNAVQIGFGKSKKINKAQLGHSKAAKAQSKSYHEFRLKDLEEELKVGEQLLVDNFTVGESIHATALSKGKGWAGTIKRHNFHRGRKTHGGRSYRRPGSIGSMYPQKIFKGKKMAGQLGHVTVTIRNLTILYVDSNERVIGIKGAVPGPRKGLVLLRGAN